MRTTSREGLVEPRSVLAGEKAQWALFLGVAAGVLLLDRITKHLVVENLAVGEMWNPIAFLKPFITITHVSNTGAAFGLFRDYGLIFAIVALVVVVGILAFYRYLPAGKLWLRISLGLQLGGALGNLLDRVLLGSVVDFIDIKFWPVWNVADMAIVSGVALLAFQLLFVEREDERIAEADN
jgi:signal peptidase II